jgi:hypothetical protein
MAFYYNAIFFDKQSKAYKYRTIKNIERFENYITGKFDVLYCNYYDKRTKQFLFRKYFNKPVNATYNEIQNTNE